MPAHLIFEGPRVELLTSLFTAARSVAAENAGQLLGVREVQEKGRPLIYLFYVAGPLAANHALLLALLGLRNAANTHLPSAHLSTAHSLPVTGHMEFWQRWKGSDLITLTGRVVEI